MRVGVTRPASGAGDLAARLSAAGWEPVLVAAVEQRIDPREVVELASAIERAAGEAWLVVTSPTGATALLNALSRVSGPLDGHHFAVVGPSTAAVVTEAGLVVDLQPDTYNGRALGRALAEQPAGQAILAVSAIASAAVEHELAAAGWTVDRHNVYDTVAVELSSADVEALATCDVLTFTSGSAARAVAAALPDDRPPCVCLGEATADAATAAGFTVVAVADPSTLDGLVAALDRSSPTGEL